MADVNAENTPDPCHTAYLKIVVGGENFRLLVGALRYLHSTTLSLLSELGEELPEIGRILSKQESTVELNKKHSHELADLETIPGPEEGVGNPLLTPGRIDESIICNLPLPGEVDTSLIALRVDQLRRAENTTIL